MFWNETEEEEEEAKKISRGIFNEYWCRWHSFYKMRNAQKKAFLHKKNYTHLSNYLNVVSQPFELNSQLPPAWYSLVVVFFYLHSTHVKACNRFENLQFKSRIKNDVLHIRYMDMKMTKWNTHAAQWEKEIEKRRYLEQNR